MRLATYNVEWFDALFDRDGRLAADAGPSGRAGVSRAAQAEALAHVLATIDADAVMVIEAPDTNRRRDGAALLEMFAGHAGIRARRVCLGFANDTQQEIALLYDPDAIEARHDPREGSAEAPRFDGEFRIDLDIDDTLDRVRFSKPPLEVTARAASGFAFRMIGVHAKSKAPHGARSPDDAMRLAIANRRKQLAQAIWLRGRVEEELDRGTPLVVLGDFNDGPGLDEYEQLFGRSTVEIVMGEGRAAAKELIDPHARRTLSRRIGLGAPTSARFWIETEKRFLQVLVDYIMLSPDLAARRPAWRIWHPFEDPECYADAALRTALLAASDHFPVTLDIEI